MDKSLLHRIINHQMLYTSFLPGLGLYDGKMGHILFFYHAARYQNLSLCEEFADELLDEVYEDIHKAIPLHFSDGLCGIGWGVEFLAKQGFVEGITDDVLADIDLKIMEHDPRRITDYSLETGLEGIACYVTARLLSPRDEGIPFDAIYLNDLQSSCSKALDQGKYMTMLAKYPAVEADNYSFPEIWNTILFARDDSSAKKELSWITGFKMLME